MKLVLIAGIIRLNDWHKWLSACGAFGLKKSEPGEDLDKLRAVHVKRAIGPNDELRRFHLF